MSEKLSFASLVVRRTAYKLIKNQLVIILCVATLSLVLFQAAEFYACLYGGFIVVAGTLISSWRINRAGNSEKRQGYIELYLGAIQKYILTLLLFAVGIGGLHLLPIPMIIAFSLGQLAYLLVSVDTGKEVVKKK